MTIDEIKELIRVVQETGIAELEVRQGDNSVRIRGAHAVSRQELMMPAVVPVPISAATAAGIAPPAVPAPQALDAGTAASQQPASPREEAAREEIIKSPIVGTYYDAPAPGTPPFVKVGDRIEPKQVLCIIESMKLMNEIEAEYAGYIVAKHVENGRPVEYGESLFTVRPA